MAAKQLWASKSAAAWHDVQQNLAGIWKENASAKLQELNSWIEAELPAAISSRAPQQHITAAELVKLVDWKLSYGKWRPKLLDYAKAAKEEEVREASSKALSMLMNSSSSSGGEPPPAAAAAAGGGGKRKAANTKSETSKKRVKAADVAAAAAAAGEGDTEPAPAAPAAAVNAAIAAVTVLKGVGPATASALLAAAATSCPYMGDEALEAACGARAYTPKAYLQLVEALREKAAWLQQQDPATGWSAALVERCLHAAALKEKGSAAAAAGSKGAAGEKSGTNTGTATAARRKKASQA